MIMTIKLGDVLNLNRTLKRIIDNNDLDIDSLFKFRLLGIMKNIENEIMNYETIRTEKIYKYGKEITDENGNKNFGIPNEDRESMEKFTKDMNEVINSDVEVNIQKLKQTDVFDKGLPAEYLVGLYSIIEE